MLYFTIVCMIFAILATIALVATQVNINDNESEFAVMSIIACMLFVAMFFWSAYTGYNICDISKSKCKPNLPAEVQTKE